MSTILRKQSIRTFSLIWVFIVVVLEFIYFTGIHRYEYIYAYVKAT